MPVEVFAKIRSGFFYCKDKDKVRTKQEVAKE
jgi:hypothetical protein